jgi:hypothetical protein
MQRIAPNAVMSSNAIKAVNWRFLRISSSVRLQPASKPESGFPDPGRSSTRSASICRPWALAKFRMPFHRGAVSAMCLGPRRNAIWRCPSENKCSTAAWAPSSLSTMTELTEPACSSRPISAVGILNLLQIAQHVDIHEQPIRNHDQRFHPAIEQHFQIALEAAALVVYVGEDWQERSLVKRALDPPQDRCAVGIGHVENHHPDRARTLVAQGARKHIRPIAELMGGPPNSVFGRVGYITSERRIVQHNRDRGRREAALFRHLTNGHHNRVSFFDAELLT